MTRSRYLVAAATVLLVLQAAVCPGVGGAAGDVIRIPFTIHGFDAGRPFVEPRGMSFDPAQGEILVADAGAGRVQVFDRDGWPKYEFVHWVERQGRSVAGEPVAAVAAPDGNIFIIDAQSTGISLVNFRGESLRVIDAAELLPAAVDVALAACLALGSEGHVYAVCRAAGDHYLIELSDDGSVLNRTTLGAAGDLVQVTGVAVGEDRVCISDLSATSCVQVFDRSGRRELAFGIHDAGWGNFSFPAAIALSGDGQIWVVDQIRQIVNHFDSQGNFVGFIGGKGVGPGSMNYPCGLAMGDAGRVLVLEKVGRRLQAFDVPEGGDATAESGA